MPVSYSLSFGQSLCKVWVPKLFPTLSISKTEHPLSLTDAFVKEEFRPKRFVSTHLLWIASIKVRSYPLSM